MATGPDYYVALLKKAPETLRQRCPAHVPDFLWTRKESQTPVEARPDDLTLSHFHKDPIHRRVPARQPASFSLESRKENEPKETA